MFDGCDVRIGRKEESNLEMLSTSVLERWKDRKEGRREPG
jgi:hypothetical protein